MPASNTLNAPFGNKISTQAPITSYPSVTFDANTLNLSNPAVTLVPSMQSTPLYVVSNPHSYAGDVFASTQTAFDHSHRREYVPPGRRPTVLTDSSNDDDTDIENRPGGKQSYAVKTPCRSKPHSKSQGTVQNDENTAHNNEMQYLRGQFEQYAQVLQSLSNRVEDLTDTVTAAPLEQTAVKQTETDSTNSLVDQMRVLIDTVSKKRKTRKTKLSTLFEQSSASEIETENVPQRHLIRPMKFDGVGSFETFMAHFRNCATHNRWNQTEQLSWLKNSLIKNAGQVLWDSSPESTDTLPKLIELLTNRFGGTKQTDKHRMELRYRKRRPNESLSE